MQKQTLYKMPTRQGFLCFGFVHKFEGTSEIFTATVDARICSFPKGTLSLARGRLDLWNTNDKTTAETKSYCSRGEHIH